MTDYDDLLARLDETVSAAGAPRWATEEAKAAADAIRDLLDEIEALRVWLPGDPERAALLADAERYRWLRADCYAWGQDCVSADEQSEVVAMWVKVECATIDDIGIDAAIDAARGK